MNAPASRLINTWDQLRAAVLLGVIQQDRAVAVGWSWNLGRGHYRTGAQVWSPFFDVGDREKAHWTDVWHGQKVPRHFHSLRHDGLTGARKAAIAWAMQTYGYTEFKRNRVGDWVPAEVQKALPIPKPS